MTEESGDVVRADPEPGSGPGRSSSRLRDAVTSTLLLTGAITASGIVLASVLPTEPLLRTAPTGGAAVVAVLALGCAFFVAELGQALVEVRRQAYSFSLSGVPLLLGLLFVPPSHLLTVRLAAAVLAFSVQRASPVKFAFNTASYLLDTVLVLTLVHALVPAGGALTLRTAALCYAALAVVDLVMSLLVLLVIRINEGPLARAEVAEVLLPASAFVLLNTAVALISATLLASGLLGGLLLVAFAGLTAAAYRGFLVLRARHQSLQLVQDFVEHSEGAGSVEELAEALLAQLRTLLRASRVELTLLDDLHTVSVHLSADDGGVVMTTPEHPTPDPLLARVLADGAPLLIGQHRRADPEHRWLDARGARDALVVPLSRAGTLGVVVALDRVGEATAFTRDDLALLQTLAGHLAVALHSRRLVERLRFDATHDALTGLPNRALLIERLTQVLAPPVRGLPAVLLLDLNRFKEVNDALGHHVGDELLRVVAQRLQSRVHQDATVARLGGDEFAILLPGVPDLHRDGLQQQAAVESYAITVAQSVAQALRSPVDLPDVVVSTEASIGIAVARPGQLHTDLLRHADTAMYAAKAAGVPLTVFSPHLDRGRVERLALLADLHQALENDELELQYQPKLDLAFGVVTSVEALVRWNHPTLGTLSPRMFVPLAESTGLIEQLTQTVLAKALKQCREWQDSGLDLAVAVNLSARNINNTALPDQVAAALAEAGLPAHKLILELTESSVMGDVERTVPTLNRLAAIGVTLSLDDFGTGYSSLSYLQRLPVRELKIDSSFVLGLDQRLASGTSELLIRSIIGLGHGLGLRVVAEGVESAQVLEQLRGLGCDLIQGYHVGRPVDAADLATSLMRIEPSGRAAV